MQPNSDINYFLLLLVLLLAIGATTSCGLLGTDGDSPARPDTTSSNFVWTADTLGKINTVFRDVAILDSNNIWIAGNIPEEDFEGGNSYNAMNWNGQIWEKIRLLIKTYDGRVIEYPLVTIFQVDESTKWAFSSLGDYSEFSMGR